MIRHSRCKRVLRPDDHKVRTDPAGQRRHRLEVGRLYLHILTYTRRAPVTRREPDLIVITLA
jgi:hypothetical protein